MPETASAAPRSSRRQDLVLAAAMFVLTGVVFWPVVRWLATETFAREQLKQSFFIVVLAGLWIAWEKRRVLRLDLQFSNVTLTWLGVSYLLAFAALELNNPLFLLAGLVAAVGGMVNYVFGRLAFRRTLPLLSVFALLILCVLLFPLLDWPLRQMAGLEAARLLKSIGFAPELAVSTADSTVKLLLVVGPEKFVVATECNGFGLITSSLLLGLIRLLYQRAAWGWFAVLLPLCVATAFAFNFLRIAAIIVLAPRFPGHYHAMHETAGVIALYSGLGTVWLITGAAGRAPISARDAL
jgi:exosortase/archaeosortase family protein